MNKKNRSNSFGFTVAELLVSVSIIAIIGTITIANYRSGEKRSAIETAAVKLASDIRKTQAEALGLKEFPASGSFPDGGWGIYLYKNGDRYVFFGDLNSDGDMFGDVNENLPSVKLPSGIKVVNSNFEGLDASGNPYNRAEHLYIVFEPPDPIVHINALFNPNVPGHPHNEWDCQTVEIVLENPGTSLTKKVVVNKFGLIDIEN